MKRIVRILTVNSVREIFKYKSFTLLILLLIILDRVMHRYVKAGPDLDLAKIKTLGLGASAWVYNELPGIIRSLLSDYRSVLVLAALFMLKELISMWPSSDMRRMHRRERQGFGIMAALFSLRWSQVLWDAVAVGSLCLVLGTWTLLSFAASRAVWSATGSSSALVLLAGLLFLIAPVGLGGLSYSSKLAVISHGGFAEKLSLFFLLFTNWKVFWASWIFFLLRVLIESVFVALIPAAVLLFVESFWVRIILASLLVAPVYSFLKMASFKFFLEIYKDKPLVAEEYRRYFSEM